jgi:heterotetrameric sarcosine oxidase gamma subunit
VLDLRQLSSPIPPLDTAGRGDPATARAILRERPFVGKVMLRLDARYAWEGAEASFGLAVQFPAAGFATRGEGLSILSLSRDAYLLITPPNGQYDLMLRLRAALSGKRVAIADVSSGYSTFRLSGPASTELLYRGCSAPLDAPDFACGRCITTKVAKVTAIIHRIDDARGFDIHVPRSLGRSLWAWLADAGKDCALLIAASNLDPEPS